MKIWLRAILDVLGSVTVLLLVAVVILICTAWIIAKVGLPLLIGVLAGAGTGYIVAVLVWLISDRARSLQERNRRQ